ncbi:MAG: ferredoxin [Planctomycetes bacterium]|nr:ferredoxin [Planctomycetota bacterium]
MPTKELITKVWIDPGCIVCDACETAAPTVFEVLEETCIVRPAALDMEFTKPLTESIIEAAEECPVDVIKFETVATEVSEEELAPPPPPRPRNRRRRKRLPLKPTPPSRRLAARPSPTRPKALSIQPSALFSRLLPPAAAAAA